MTTLAERFREVEFTFDRPPLSPEPLPGTWMQVSTSASVLRFIESRFNEERTTADIRRSFGEVRNVTFTPMSLRSIFLAMAKNGSADWVRNGCGSTILEMDRGGSVGTVLMSVCIRHIT
jgi:ABC-2 type transport system ATP-binding protein